MSPARKEGAMTPEQRLEAWASDLTSEYFTASSSTPEDDLEELVRAALKDAYLAGAEDFRERAGLRRSQCDTIMAAVYELEALEAYGAKYPKVVARQLRDIVEAALPLSPTPSKEANDAE